MTSCYSHGLTRQIHGLGLLRSVYHGHEATRRLKELVRAYETPSLDVVRTMLRIKDHAFWFSFVGSDPTRIQFLDSTGPRIIPSYLNRVLCAPGLARPSRAGTREGKSSNHSAVGATSPP